MSFLHGSRKSYNDSLVAQVFATYGSSNNNNNNNEPHNAWSLLENLFPPAVVLIINALYYMNFEQPLIHPLRFAPVVVICHELAADIMQLQRLFGDAKERKKDSN